MFLPAILTYLPALSWIESVVLSRIVLAVLYWHLGMLMPLNTFHFWSNEVTLLSLKAQDNITLSLNMIRWPLCNVLSAQCECPWQDLCLNSIVLCSQQCFLFQALSQDKESLMKLKKSVKDIQQSGMSKYFQIKLEYKRYHCESKHFALSDSDLFKHNSLFQITVASRWTSLRRWTSWGTRPSPGRTRRTISGRPSRSLLLLPRSSPHWWKTWWVENVSSPFTKILQ